MNKNVQNIKEIKTRMGDLRQKRESIEETELGWWSNRGNKSTLRRERMSCSVQSENEPGGNNEVQIKLECYTSVCYLYVRTSQQWKNKVNKYVRTEK